MTINKQEQKIHLFTKQTNIVYPELHQFLKQIEHNSHSWLDQPYQAYKGKVDGYRIIFFILGAIFFSLGLFIFMKQPNWFFHQLFVSSHFLKYVVFAFSWGMSFASLFIALTMRTELEVLNLFASRARQEVWKSYRRHSINDSFYRFIPFSSSYSDANSIKKGCLDTLDAIQRLKEEYAILLQRIAKSDLDRKERETLFNQTLLRFKDLTNH